jgi:BCD family chlorophyll transporter-like MFS transporter
MSRALDPLGWPGIVRLGLVQSAIGGVVMLATKTLNRVMVVEYAQAAALPAAFVAFHYVVQLSRPRWGHGSDSGRRRTPWIIGGVGVLGLGTVLAALAVTLLKDQFWPAMALAIVGYAMVGAGVGAAGTSLLALLATRTAPDRRPAAASLTWIMMIFGIAVTAGLAGQALKPFSPERLLMVAAGVAVIALAVAVIGVWGQEGEAASAAQPAEAGAFQAALAGIWADPRTRLFTIFIFVSMVAFSTQELIVGPFAGLVFGMSPGDSTKLDGIEHGGVFLGMVLVGLGGHRLGEKRGFRLRPWIVGGCVASALAVAALASAAAAGPGWPLAANLFVLGFANGVFAVAAIGAMMELANEGSDGRAGLRMGLWGAAQAIAFALGGFFGATGVEAGRRLIGADAPAFQTVFLIEALLFLAAAAIATQLAPARRQPKGVLA